MSWITDLEPVEVELFYKDRKTGEFKEGKAWIKEFDEKDVEVRTRILQQPVSNESSRRGRSRRGRDQLHIERIRQFNFERGVLEWDLTYPDEVWDPNQKKRVPHPQAGEVIPINRQTYYIIPERVMDQIQEAINELNEPPEMLEDVRDEDRDEDRDEEYADDGAERNGSGDFSDEPPSGEKPSGEHRATVSDFKAPTEADKEAAQTPTEESYAGR